LAYGGMKDENQRDAIRSIGPDGAPVGGNVFYTTAADTYQYNTVTRAAPSVYAGPAVSVQAVTK
jgi:hypothetical protein